MKKLIVLMIAVLTANMGLAQNGGMTEVGEVMMPNNASFGGEDLILNGGGIRKKAYVLKLYSGGLYLKAKSKDEDKIINADETMAMKLIITSSFVSSEAMEEAINDGFDASMRGDTSSLKSQIDKFKGFFSTEEIVEKDVFDITYQSGKGVVCYKNGKELGTIPGMEFKKALFAIWLGDNPADKKLKKGMLSGK